jgi:exopolysaccharide production protein ExoQ
MSTRCSDLSPSCPKRQDGGLQFSLLVLGVSAWCYFGEPMDIFYTLGHTSLDSYIGAIREGSLGRQVSLLLMGIWATASLLLHRFKVHLDGRVGGPALIFLFIVVASVGWSDDPFLSAKRVAALLTFAVCCIALAQRVGVDNAASLAFWVSAIVVVVGCGAEIALGTFAPFDPAYRFSGTVHPNLQGAYCACLTLAGVSLARRHHARAYAFGAGIGLVFLFLTKSRTCLISALASLAFYFTLTSARVRYWLLIVLTAGAVAAIPIVLLDTGATARISHVLLLGRPEDVSTVATLTGRTELWQELVPYVYERPLFGFGYGCFWTPQRLTQLTRRQGWVFGSAHSEYIEIVLSVGVLGLAAYCLTGLAVLWRLTTGYWRTGADSFAFGAAMIALTAVDMVGTAVPVSPSLPIVSCVTIVAGLALVDAQENAEHGG